MHFKPRVKWLMIKARPVDHGVIDRSIYMYNIISLYANNGEKVTLSNINVSLQNFIIDDKNSRS